MSAHGGRPPKRLYRAKELGVFIANARRERGFGLGELARRAGMPLEQLAAAETGATVLDDLELSHLAAALSLSKVVLLEEAGLITFLRTRMNGQGSEET